MKLISYVHAGRAGFGIVKEQGVIALGARTHQPSLKHVLNSIDTLRTYANERPDLRLDEVTYAPAIPNPDKIFCVGINYLHHQQETGHKLPEHPLIFTRFANSQVGHEQPIIRPRVSEQLDFEESLPSLSAGLGDTFRSEMRYRSSPVMRPTTMDRFEIGSAIQASSRPARILSAQAPSDHGSSRRMKCQECCTRR